MMLTPVLAKRNLLGAGIRTWLNVIVTSLAFFMIIFTSGLYDGMIAFTKRVTVATEIGGGQYWHPQSCPRPYCRPWLRASSCRCWWYRARSIPRDGCCR